MAPVLPAAAAPPPPQIQTSATVSSDCTAVVRATWSGVRNDNITARIFIRSGYGLGTGQVVEIPVTKQRGKVTLTFTGTATTIDNMVRVEGELYGYPVNPTATAIDIDAECIDWQRVQ